MIKVLALYLCAVSLLAVMMTVIDKRSARKGKKRISEKSLFLVALFGGAAFMYIIMQLIRHKTLHKRFMLGLPAIVALHVIILCIIFI